MSPLVVGVNGETLTIPEWAARLKCSPQTIYRRLELGWDPIRAVTQPVRECIRGRKPSCSLPGCRRQRSAKGLCHKHYHEKKRRERRERKDAK